MEPVGVYGPEQWFGRANEDPSVSSQFGAEAVRKE